MQDDVKRHVTRATTEGRNPRTLDIDTLSTEDMLRKINEEDRKVADVVAGEISNIARAVDASAEAIRGGGRLFYVGAGTSGRIGVLDAAECPPTFGTDPETVQALMAGGERAFIEAIEGAEDDREQGAADIKERGVNERDVVVGIAASGRTPYVIGAMEAAKQAGAQVVAVVCNEGSPMEKVADITICTVVGPEVIMGSTRMKAGTAQKLVLNMLSTGAMIRLGKVYSNLMINMVPTNEKLVGRAVRIVQLATDTDDDVAADLLERAGQRIDVAIVMHEAGVDAEKARELLQQSEGNVRGALAAAGKASGE